MVKGVERLVRAAHIDIDESATTGIDPQPYRERFIGAMDDDFGTPQAIAALFDLAREINRGRDEGLHIGEAHETLLELAGVLGLALTYEPTTPRIPYQTFIELVVKYGLEIKEATDGEDQDIASYIVLLIEKRAELRLARKWQLADEIRGDLKELGITLEDGSQGTVWRYGNP